MFLWLGQILAVPRSMTALLHSPLLRIADETLCFRSVGALSEISHKRLGEIFTQAKSDKWSVPEEALYEFRDAEPFPK